MNSQSSLQLKLEPVGKLEGDQTDRSENLVIATQVAIGAHRGVYTCIQGPGAAQIRRTGLTWEGTARELNPGPG